MSKNHAPSISSYPEQFANFVQVPNKKNSWVIQVRLLASSVPKCTMAKKPSNKFFMKLWLNSINGSNPNSSQMPFASPKYSNMAAHVRNVDTMWLSKYVLLLAIYLIVELLLIGCVKECIEAKVRISRSLMEILGPHRYSQIPVGILVLWQIGCRGNGDR
jgi:hypothetical protein